MFHHTQLHRGWDPENHDFDFEQSFTYVKDYLNKADITLANFETTLAGPMGALMYVPETHVRGYQAYPTFNSPDEVLENIKDAGFDILLTANNHCMDSGIEGLDRTLEQISEHELLAVGTSKTAPASPLYISMNQMDISLINWGYGTNGITIPTADENRVNSLLNYREDRINEMLEQISQADESGVDWVIVAIHFGPEYKTQPYKNLQEDLVNRMIEHGADIILGSHPHVLQPMEIRYRKTVDGEEPVFIIYSLGNFLASQPWRSYRPYETDNSIILNLTLELDSQERKYLSNVEIIPIYTQWNSQEIRVVPVVYALSEPGQKILGHSNEDARRLPWINEYVPSHMLSRMPGYTRESHGDILTLVPPTEENEDELAVNQLEQQVEAP